MIIEEKRDLVYMITPMPAGANMLSFNWVYNMPEEGALKGFLVVYSKAGMGFSDCLQSLRTLEEGYARALITSGGWVYGTPSGSESNLIWASPLGNSSFKIHSQTFRAPCSIEVWAVVEQAEQLYLYYKESPSYKLSLKLQHSVKAKEFEPAEYGFLHRLRKPAVSGVELVLSSETGAEDYEDGAVFYRLASDSSKATYPIARAALGKPLRFVSTESFQYKASDFEVAVSPEFTNMYEL